MVKITNLNLRFINTSRNRIPALCSRFKVGLIQRSIKIPIKVMLQKKAKI